MAATHKLFNMADEKVEQIDIEDTLKIVELKSQYSFVAVSVQGLRNMMTKLTDDDCLVIISVPKALADLKKPNP